METTFIIPGQPLYASQLVEIPVSGAGLNVVPIPDQPQLRNQGDEIIIVKSVRLITAKVLAVAPTIGGNNMPLADLVNASLILYANGWERGYLIPLLTLNDVHDADATTASTIPYVQNPVQFADWENVDWNKSKIQFSAGTTTSDAGSFILQVQYQKFIVKNGQKVQVM